MDEINEYVEALHRVARDKGYTSISVQTLQVIMMNYVALYNPPLEPGRKMYKTDETPVETKLTSIVEKSEGYSFDAAMKAYEAKKAKAAAARAGQNVKAMIQKR